MKRYVNIGLVGTQFMGKAHSNAWVKVSRFFDTPVIPVLHTACSRSEAQRATFVDQYHWKRGEPSWEKVIESKEIELVDICTPNDLHMPVAVAAAKSGKHILCEKPMARNAAEAAEMYRVVKEAGVIHMMIFNYRFVPAIALAKKFISEGKIGEVRHFNAVYYQDWLTDPEFPITWRHDAKASGSGAHGDMNAHIVDLARYLVGEFASVTGIQKTFIGERPLSSGNGRGKVSTDDATSFLATFQNGALGSFQATRLAPGRKNFLRMEIFGSKGSFGFNLERMNELEYYSDGETAESQGYKNILVTDASHPYIKAWWPPGHIIGWEHTFIHQIKELLDGIGDNKNVIPDFYDGLRCQQVLDAVVTSASTKTWTKIPDHKEQKHERVKQV
ncbi:MAG: Gfo/Idh/MocA family oxidoreductase [Cyclobacteriaceae bacterium]